MAANLNSSLLEGNASTSLNVAITAGAAGGHTDDSAFTAGTDDVGVAGGFFNDSTPDSVDEGDAGALRMSGNRVGYRTIRDAAGNERGANVNASNALEVAITSGAAGGHTDDAPFAVGTDDVAISGGLFDDSAPDSVDEGDGGALRMSANRVGYRTLRDAAGNERGANVTAANELNVIESSAAAALTALQLIDDIVFTDDTSTHATGTTKGAGIMAAAVPTDTAVAANDIGMLAMSLDRRLHTDTDITASVALDVSAATVTVAGTGTFVVQEDGAALTALELIDNTVAVLGTATYTEGSTSGNVIGGVRNDTLEALAGTDNEIAPFQFNAIGALYTTGDVAHDAVDSGNSIKQGAVAIAHGTNPTAVAAADRTDLLANRAGIPFVIGGHPAIITTRTNFTAAATNTALVTIAGGLKIVVTRVTVTADNANTVDVQARVGFATTTTPTGVGVLLSHPGIAAGSGVVEGNGSGILGVGADGEDLRITSEVPTTGSIDVVTSHYTIES